MTAANESNSNSATSSHKSHEEPEITQEEAVPNDGRDIEGEELMKSVENKKLEQKPGQEKQDR